MLTTIQLGVSTVFSTAHERDSIACLHDFSGPALLSCSKILTYQLLGSQLWTALPLEKSRLPATVNHVSKPRHNSRTKLCIELSLVHNRDNIEFYLYCKFQSSPFSVRCKNSVTDRQNDRQRDYSMPRGSAHRGIMTHTHTYTHTTRLLYASWLRPPRHNDGKTKTAQYVHDIELHFTKKVKRTQTRKLKRFVSNQKDVGL